MVYNRAIMVYEHRNLETISKFGSVQALTTEHSLEFLPTPRTTTGDQKRSISKTLFEALNPS